MKVRELSYFALIGVVAALLVGSFFTAESRQAARKLRLSVARAVVLLQASQLAPVGANDGPSSSLPSSTSATTEQQRADQATEVIKRSTLAAQQQEQAALVASAAAIRVRPRRVGIFVSDSPIDASSVGRLNSYSALGVDTVFNYSILDGSSADIARYLDKAQSLNIKVIFSLKDLYDQLGPANYRTLYTYPIGGSNQEAAINAVRQFGSHPAVWGFAISDERPESPAEAALWQPIMQQRYRLVKQNTSKPVMMVLVGATASSSIARSQFLRGLRSSTDTFALDYYPIPFQPTNFIASIGQDLVAAGDSDGWFVAQAFSWSKYPDTAQGLGFSPASARPPSASEMVSMAGLALNSGARNILFYSYFDIAGDSGQLAALQQAIAALRN